MLKHEIVSCPRCNRTFECRVNSIHRCQCSDVPLTLEERFRISEKYQGCLCENCLRELKAVLQQQPNAPL
ncbi:cysteine-rich CWC family protein [Chitinophaga sp. G-6-1-13]|uniref:Cysteine-rich CWC family protein n=1 Tax=Chitinophaga fulva TaxID=2728842 RepID=A0A848H1U7_9BACT|nr:cysteine-rich CWC family protein [Chitinophaga fulva]NML41788.1 cysteine-rich CWC family protein [Chitinophaga fulva]